MLQLDRHLWTIDIYEMAVLIRNFEFWSGEMVYQNRFEGSHLLRWDNVLFPDRTRAEIHQSQLCRVLASLAQVLPHSLKHQPVACELPERSRQFYPPNNVIVSGLLSTENRGCAVTILQGWYVASGAASRPLSSPICTRPNGTHITAEEVITALRRVPRDHSIPDLVIVLHSLKHDATTTLVEQGFTDEAGRLAAGFSSALTLKSYDHCRPVLGDKLS